MASLGDVLLLFRDLLGLALRVGDVALAARLLIALELTLRVAQPIGGRGGLAGRRRIALGRGALHRIGGAAQLPRGVGQVLAILIARQLLELPRGFFGLLGERALQVAAVAAGRLARRQAALPLDFLFLPARQLLQLLGQLVDLLILLLRRGLRIGLVLVRHLVEFHLEQIGQVVGDRSGAAAAAAAAGLPAGLHLQLELFFGLLQELQRQVLRRQRAVRTLRLQLLLRRRHLLGRLRQQLRDLLERRIRHHQAAVHALRPGR